MDEFSKHRSGITHPTALPAVNVPASQPIRVEVMPMSTPVNAVVGALVSSREDVLTRAAALGRGAATTGFKRFLALTEAAKDRKDSPFRKLFNT